RELSGPAAEPLLAQVLGTPLPVTRMAGWLTGRQAAQRDRLGRAERLDAADWTVDYAYDSDAADAPPARLTLRYTGQGELAAVAERYGIALRGANGQV
ncbi:MAG TPA: lipoprotein insertase outer membrane protein LolB, partial [Rhodocyclaceae bacterium]|nr:lipoprotein insertase outer membrane protein LolB [Rhodocyclaceae bacterium]